MRELLTPQAEDYLKAIYDLTSTPSERVNTQDIADRLAVTPASVTGMLKKLAELGLIEHAPYQGARLTETGTKIALELLRHHRLLELYLHQALGYALEDVHREAEKLEHHISEEFEARIYRALGEPTHDPHGDPIPTLEGRLPDTGSTPLTSLKAGDRACVARVPDRDAEFLRHIATMGLTPGAVIEVLEVAPFKGPITLRIHPRGVLERSVQLGHESAERILTSREVADA